MPAYRPAAVVMAANIEEAPPPIDTDRLGRPIVGPCHLWVKALDSKGYGVIGNRDFGSTAIQRVHRVAYALARGVPLADIRSVPELDHLCRVTRCCAPPHLEEVTHGENVQRGDTALINGGREECIRGHPFNEENTRYYRRAADGGSSRVCRVCVGMVRRGEAEPRPKRPRRSE